MGCGDQLPCSQCGATKRDTTGALMHADGCPQIAYSGGTQWVYPNYYQWSGVLAPQQGWICPVCGQGVAPWMPYCPNPGCGSTGESSTGTEIK